ncbi:hypothetical protein JZ751_026561 [Albula glossodonta]|uniref:Uncharacterized protein n=1 Tax=Albula glossodonta TaxID=121402 RepID=A0A8T2PKX6_9TELE|nr:hypothetical protein JZ751_026561 [Albula glossodonta]
MERNVSMRFDTVPGQEEGAELVWEQQVLLRPERGQAQKVEQDPGPCLSLLSPAPMTAGQGVWKAGCPGGLEGKHCKTSLSVLQLPLQVLLQAQAAGAGVHLHFAGCVEHSLAHFTPVGQKAAMRKCVTDVISGTESPAWGCTSAFQSQRYWEHYSKLYYPKIKFQELKELKSIAPQGSIFRLLLGEAQSALPGGGLKFKREDDGVAVADLADETPLTAEVTVVDVAGCKLDQGHGYGAEVGQQHAICLQTVLHQPVDVAALGHCPLGSPILPRVQVGVECPPDEAPPGVRLCLVLCPQFECIPSCQHLEEGRAAQRCIGHYITDGLNGVGEAQYFPSVLLPEGS